jgi:hypothetical protein
LRKRQGPPSGRSNVLPQQSSHNFHLFLHSENRLQIEKDDADKGLWDVLVAAPTEAYDMIMDPNKKEREEEEKLRKEVKQSKKHWRVIRKERFAFLDANAGGDGTRQRSLETNTTVEEKKVEDSVHSVSQAA